MFLKEHTYILDLTVFLYYIILLVIYTADRLFTGDILYKQVSCVNSFQSDFRIFTTLGIYRIARAAKKTFGGQGFERGPYISLGITFVDLFCTDINVELSLYSYYVSAMLVYIRPGKHLLQ